MNDSIKNRIEYLEGLEKIVVGKTPSDDYFFDKLGIKGFPNMENLPNIRFESISFPGHENLDFLKDMFEGMLLLRRVFEPLEIFYHYIYNHRIFKLLITNILNKEEKQYKPPFAPDVIYTGLVQLDKHTADCIIGVMSGFSSKKLENLRRAFLQGKKNFIMVLEGDDYDAEKGSKLLRSCKLKLDKDKNDESIFDFLQAGKNQIYIDEFKKELGDLWPIIQVLLEFDEDVENGDWETKQYSFGDKSFRSVIELACDHIVESIFSIKTPLLPGEKTIFERIVECSIYEKHYEEIKSKFEKKKDSLILTAEGGKEKKQQTSQIKEPAAEEGKDTPILVKNDFIEQEPTKEKGHLYPDSKYEFVPENYFEPDCFSKGHTEEHYELVDRVKKHGLQAFVDFINYIAKEGFIENDDETKALLAYRLTGRMRPKKLDKIPWFKEKGEPKELYYIIKYFSPRTQKKFSKQMKDYFENDYFGVANYSRTAEDVSDDFMDKLEDLFPGLTNTSKG